MKSVRAHAFLLAAALLASFLTLTRERPTGTERERVMVWNNDTTAVMALEYRSEERDIDITRRPIGEREYLWGVEDDRTPPIIPPDADSATATALRLEAAARREFPAGIPAADLFRGFAALRVIRDLGPLATGAEDLYGLAEPRATLVVVLADERRELEIGDPTPGEEDRYALDRTTGRAYVVPGDLLQPFENGEDALRERRLHYFPPADIGRVLVTVGGRERTMLQTGVEGGGTWASEGEPEQPDQAFANFMGRVAQLTIEGFRAASDVGPMEPLLRVDYLDRSGASLGFVELHRSAPSPVASGPERYFLLSERVPVPADALYTLAERVHSDLGQLF